ncbi:BLUF domain-containing protein [Leeia sp. TBRC 13508]|uniref:BLUF domain-containing protein n=1 Tax=Leeia speluncae TaxID=2884804 RepID=A0ABS8D807_9NEIS|nr:BLUF domain-containing protein [Leeia speluncae]MCB6184324.1 BLUF domain-containing protein [Leeia speluncae]
MGSNPLLQLIYVSQASTDLTEEDLIQIIQTSVKNNQQKELTGMLLLFEGTFMQLLEGTADKLEETLKTIENDPRHHSLVVYFRSHITAREFADWHMGFKHLDHSDIEKLPGYLPAFDDGFDLRKVAVNPQDGVALFKAIAQEHIGQSPSS